MRTILIALAAVACGDVYDTTRDVGTTREPEPTDARVTTEEPRPAPAPRLHAPRRAEPTPGVVREASGAAVVDPNVSSAAPGLHGDDNTAQWVRDEPAVEPAAE